MGLRKPTLKKYRQILDAYRAGLQPAEIAESLNYSRSAIYRALKFFGIRPGRDTRRSQALIIPLFEQGGYSRREIAEKLGYSYAHTCLVIQSYLKNPEPAIRPRAPFNPEPYEIDFIDPVWAAEFRGFFYGDGCAMLGNSTGSYLPVLTISLRADNAPLLKNIQDVLGGTLHGRDMSDSLPNSKPQTIWRISGWPKCRGVLEGAGFIQAPVFPAKKCKDIAILYAAIQYRYSIPYWMTDEERAVLADYYLALREVKRFQL